MPALLAPDVEGSAGERYEAVGDRHSAHS
jgi:hypothetical protein